MRAEFCGTARFKLISRLGEGGMGVVYEAYDQEIKEHVALKTLGTLSAESLLLLKNEFRSLQGLQHPNLVRLGDLFEDQGQWFYTMELVPGEHFMSYVRPGHSARSAAGSAHETVADSDFTIEEKSEPIVDEDESTIPMSLLREASLQKRARPQPPSPSPTHGGPDEDRLRSTLGQLVLGLHALHTANKVHCDIKPSNIDSVEGLK